MATQQVPPLRIQKGTNSVSPNKTSITASRPLSEVSAMALRRNSPSFPQSKGNFLKADSPQPNPSPLALKTTGSPRLFWQGRETSPARENQNPNDSPTKTVTPKRSSIENLKKASRVKNSSMFALEQNSHYDPARPTILDGRPLSTSFVGRTNSVRKEDLIPRIETKQIEAVTEEINIPSPTKGNTSPTKSSLSKRTGANNRFSGFDPRTGIWQDQDTLEGSSPGFGRQAKSVTFDRAPPQINEYDLITPDPSSIASESREGSYDSAEDDDDEDISFERGSSLDHDDSFDASLEDTQKTPVVLPEDWRFMNPHRANTELAQHEEDVFDDHGSPDPNAQPGYFGYRPHQTSVNSVDSNGQPRPLPPLPNPGASPILKDSFSGTIERISGSPRGLPSPPAAASISKNDLRRMSNGFMSMEDRLRLMMPNDKQRHSLEVDVGGQQPGHTSEIRPKNLLQAPVLRPAANGDNEAVSGLSNGAGEAPAITRDNILRRLRSLREQDNGDAVEESLPDARRDFAAYDPDMPIPSREDPTQTFRDEMDIKEEEADDSDLYNIPDMYSGQSDTETSFVADGESHEQTYNEFDGNSQFSYEEYQPPASLNGDDGQETPRAMTPGSPVKEQFIEPAQDLPPVLRDEPVQKPEPVKKKLFHERISLPDFADFGDSSTFNIGLESFMTPPELEKSTSESHRASVILPDLEAIRLNIQRPYTPVEPIEPIEPPHCPFDEATDEPGTPDSVIKRPLDKSRISDLFIRDLTPASPQRLNRDASQSAVSEMEENKDENRNLRSRSLDPALEVNSTKSEAEIETVPQTPQVETTEEASNHKSQKRVSSLMQLDLPHDTHEESLIFGLEKEFDRVVETQKVAFELSLRKLYQPLDGISAPVKHPDPKDTVGASPDIRGFATAVDLCPQVDSLATSSRLLPAPLRTYANKHSQLQRGYLMRHNTKVVVASERMSQEEIQATATPVLPAHETPTLAPPPANIVQPSPRQVSQPTWTAEPWTAKPRRKSIRVGGEKGTTKVKNVDGPIPPLPGQASAVQAPLNSVTEDELAEEEAEDFEDGAERGRLFVKVVGVKDLELPFSQSEKSQFALTLDNGLHCVTTAWLDLHQDAPIGQEFELIVLNELEFQLTLQMKLEPPPPQRAASPVKPPASPKKQGAFGRLFGSPKKRKESEIKAQEIQASKRPVTPPSTYELVKGLVAKDGSFARAYISLNEHEKQAYGRPHSVDITCFNEWAMEEVHVGSSRSKKDVQLQKRPPYAIGKLELQLLYVPKPKGAKDEDMPKSMNGAVRAMREAEEKLAQQVAVTEFDGHLSQQGGDCPYWRRRYFKLVGSKLTAYHETTLQPRATINLAKATRLIDDKNSLTQKETSTKGGRRRKSAFAEEEEGYMFVEEGFRIRFANGEVIDFYADTTDHKEEWMKVLAQIVGKGQIPAPTSHKEWIEVVLKRERTLAAKDKKARPTPPERKSSKEVHQEPASNAIPQPTRPAPVPAPRSQGHMRSESYQPEGGSRSQANSPVKNKMTREERAQKARSMAF